MSFGGRGKAPQQNQFDEIGQMFGMKMMMSTWKTCFSDCVTDFRAGDLSQSEKTCLQNCAMRLGSSYQAGMETFQQV